MPKACRSKPHKEDIPKFDVFFQDLTSPDNRTLIDLASVGGDLRYFSDSVHLIPARAGIYAKTLVDQLNPIFDRVGIKRKPVKAKPAKKKSTARDKSRKTPVKRTAKPSRKKGKPGKRVPGPGRK